jgi:hypothetical protein
VEPQPTAAFRPSFTAQPRLLFPAAPGAGARLAEGFSPLRPFVFDSVGGAGKPLA